MRHAEGLDQLHAGDRGGSGAVADEPRRAEVAAGELQRVDQSGERDDRGAMLVVVEDRDVHQLAQAALDDEAVGRADVLQVDPAEGGPEVAYGIDEFVDVLGVHFEVDRIDVGEALEEHGLALHHGLRRERPEIAEPEDRGAVRDDGDEVAARRVVEGRIRIGCDALHGNRDARANKRATDRAASPSASSGMISSFPGRPRE